MRLGLVVTDAAVVKEYETTVMLAYEAVNRGHEVWLIGVGELVSSGWESLRGLGVTSPPGPYR